MTNKFNKTIKRLLKESEDDLLEEKTINLFYGHSYTSGHHAADYRNDEPAPSPYSKLKIDNIYETGDSTFDDFLKTWTLHVLLQKDHGGSYHEQWLYVGAKAVLEIPSHYSYDIDQILEGYRNHESFDTYVSEPDKEQKIYFHSMEQVGEALDEFVHSYGNEAVMHAVKKDETREEYWERMMKQAQMQSPQKKRVWDGD